MNELLNFLVKYYYISNILNIINHTKVSNMFIDTRQNNNYVKNLRHWKNREKEENTCCPQKIFLRNGWQHFGWTLDMYGVVAPVRYSPLYSICSYQPIMHWKVELIRTSSAIYKYFLWGLPWQTIEHTCNLLLKWHTSSQVCQIYRNCCWFVHCNREVESINEKQWIWFFKAQALMIKDSNTKQLSRQCFRASGRIRTIVTFVHHCK